MFCCMSIKQILLATKMWSFIIMDIQAVVINVNGCMQDFIVGQVVLNISMP
jgi:hypothetical protein